MFDWFEFDPPLVCPGCGEPVRRGQGKQGPNFLLVWRQGNRHPVAHAVDESALPKAVDLTEFELPHGDGPAAFDVEAWCDAGHSCGAEGVTVDGVWTLSRVTAPRDGVLFGPPSGHLRTDDVSRIGVDVVHGDLVGWLVTLGIALPADAVTWSRDGSGPSGTLWLTPDQADELAGRLTRNAAVAREVRTLGPHPP